MVLTGGPLYPAGICEAQIAPRFKIVAIENLNRLDDVNLIAVPQLFIRRFSDNKVHMNRVDGFALRMLVENSTDGAKHVVHRLS